MASLDFNFYWIPGRCARYPILERKFKLRGDLAYYGIDSFFTKRPCNTTNPARHCFSKFSDFHDGCSSPTYYDAGTCHGREIFPEEINWVTVACMIILGSVGYLLLITSLRVGELSAIMPFRYSRIVFLLMLGWVFFGESPSLAILLGSALIIISDVYVMWREGLARRRVN